MDWLDLLAVQRTLKSLLQHHCLKAPILQRSAFFIVQLSYPYMTTGKTIALTRWNFAGKVMSLQFFASMAITCATKKKKKKTVFEHKIHCTAVCREPFKNPVLNTLPTPTFSMRSSFPRGLLGDCSLHHSAWPPSTLFLYPKRDSPAPSLHPFSRHFDIVLECRSAFTVVFPSLLEIKPDFRSCVFMYQSLSYDASSFSWWCDREWS